MDKFTKQATKNFLKAAREIQTKELVKKGIVINSDKSFCQVMGVHPGLLSHLKSEKFGVTLENLATFCKLFDYNMHEMVFNVKSKASTVEILDDILSKLDRINDKIG
jgi:hypothetical protein